MFENIASSIGGFFGGSNDPSQPNQPVTRSSLAKKKRMAEMLMKGGQPDNPTQMAGRYVVPISPLSTLVKTASAIMGNKMQGELDDEQGALKKSEADQLFSNTQGNDPRKIAQYLMSSDNPQFQEIGTKLLGDQLKQKDLIKLGDTLYDPNKNEAVFTAPEEGMSPYQKAMIGIEQQKLGLQRDRFGAAGNAPGSNMNKATMSAYTSAFKDQLKNVQANAAQASNNLATLDQLENLIKKTPTGPGAARQQEIDESVNRLTFGLMPLSESTKNMQQIDALSNQLVLNTGGQMKGTFSDKDVEFLKTINAGKIKDPNSNQKVIEFQRRANQRIRDQNDFYNNRAAEGADPITIEREWSEYMRNNPIVDEIGASSKGTESKTGNAKAISSDAEYNALPSGATFVGPDGKTRRKP